MKYYAIKLSVWVFYPIILTGVLVFCFFTCGNNKAISAATIHTDSVSAKKEFRMVNMPAELTSPKDKAYYLVSHYWDHFNFHDTAYIHLPAITEQAFADYIDVLPHTQKEMSYISIKTMLSKAESEPTGKVYSYFLELYKKYLYDPNSPLHNEEFYIPVADYIIGDRLSSDAEKEKAKSDLNTMKKNRIGKESTDFTYTLASGRTEQLYHIKADYTLVFFYDPGCPACKETLLHMKQLSVMSSLVENGTLKILAVYPEKDITVWEKHLDDIPGTWINSYDKHIAVKDKRLYDLKAMPTIYLLDRDKKVILKDADAAMVEHYLTSANLN